MHRSHPTHQYGVPMKESLLCRVLVFLADTPKSAAKKKKKDDVKWLKVITQQHFLIKRE